MGFISYFFAKNNPQSLLDLFKLSNSTEEKEKIVNRLVELEAYNELLKIRNDYPEKIYPILIKHCEIDNEKLYMLYQENRDFHDKIISLFLANKALDVLWNIRNNHPQKIVPFLIKYYENDNQVLLTLFNENKDYRLKILDLLMKNKAHDLIWQNIEPLEIFLVIAEKCDYYNFFETYYRLIRFIVSDAFLLSYFFTSSSKKIQMYLLLKYFSNYTGFENLEVISQYYNLPCDCETFNIPFGKSFEEVFNLALRDFNPDSFKLAYILSHKKYNQRIKEISQSSIIVNDIQIAEQDLKKKYIDLKKNANSKNEIEHLLEEEKKEKSRLISSELIDMMENIPKNHSKILQTNQLDSSMKTKVFKGKAYDLKKINSSWHISNDYISDCQMIDQDLDKQLHHLTDADDIMKAKAQAKNNKDLLITKEDFCFSIQNANIALAEDENIIDNLSYHLHHFNDEETQIVILKFSEKSQNKRWLSSILEIAKNNQKVILIHYIFKNIKHKITSKNLKILYDFLINRSIFKEVHHYQHSDSVRSIAFSPDGQYLARGRYYGDVILIRLSDFQEVYSYKHKSCVNSIAFSPDGRYLASESYCGVVKLIRLSDFQEVYSNGHRNYVNNIAFSPDGQYLASGSNDGVVKLIRLSDFQEVHHYQHSSSVRSIAFSPDGQYLASGSNDSSVKLIRLLDFKEVHSYGHRNYVNSIAFSPDGQYLASGSNDNSVKLIRLLDFKEVLSYEHRNYVNNIAFSPDGWYLASGSNDNSVILIRLSDFKVMHSYQLSDFVGRIAFSPDGEFLAISGSYKTVNLIRLSDFKVVHQYNDSEKPIAFSPDGQFFASGSVDGSVKLFCYLNLNYVGLIFLEHLIYLYFNAKTDDIKYLIDLKKKVQFEENSKLEKESLCNLLDEIIECAGKNCKNISISKEQRADSKDISIEHE